MLKINIFANYVSQIYVAAIGILLLPLYIKYMGSEAYGLIGFFSILQSFFNILDLGLTPTISRETARFKSGIIPLTDYQSLLRILTIIFVIISIFGGLILFILSNGIATNWLKPSSLPIKEVVFSVQVMSISIALRWLGGLYRGIISGHEKLVVLSSINVVIASFRFVIVFGVMWIYGFTPRVFFLYQLVIALIELLLLYLYSSSLMPKRRINTNYTKLSLAPILPLLKFSLTIAFTSSIWILVTQTDKFVLSGILSLDEYGYFSLAVLVANGIIIISSPVSSAIMPRLANLYAENKTKEIIEVYRFATQIISIFVGSTAITIIFFPELIIYAWSGDMNLTYKASPILRLYVIGNMMLVISAFPYYLQYAQGNLRYHLAGNVIMAILFVPTVILMSIKYGSLGAGYTWLTINFIFIIGWVSYVHKKIMPGLHKTWLANDFIYIIMAPIVISFIFYKIIPTDEYSRLSSILIIITVGSINLFLSILMSPKIRKSIVNIIKNKNEKNAINNRS